MTQVFMLAYQSRNMWHGSCGHKLCRHVSNTLCRLLFCILNHQAGKKRRKTAAKQRKSYIHKCKVSMHYSALIYLRISDIFLSMKNLFILISLCFTGMFCQDIFSLNYVSAIKQAWFPHRDTMHAAFLHWPVINCACIIQKSTLVYKYKYFHFSWIYVFLLSHKVLCGKGKCAGICRHYMNHNRQNIQSCVRYNNFDTSPTFFISDFKVCFSCGYECNESLLIFYKFMQNSSQIRQKPLVVYIHIHTEKHTFKLTSKNAFWHIFKASYSLSQPDALNLAFH